MATKNLNGVQSSGRDYPNLSEPTFAVDRTNDVAVETRDGTTLLADVFRPTAAPDPVPALVSFSAYPRQIQDLGAPLGFIEAGDSDFFVSRGYAHVIANARGTGGSEGTWGMLDKTERGDVYDVVEWAAAQPWCDGNVGMLGISYFAMAQLEAAVAKPPHLKAIFPLAVTDVLYEAVWHHGLLNAGFISAWLTAVGVMAGKGDDLWRSRRLDLVRHVLALPAVHRRLEHVNGEATMAVIKKVMHAHYDAEPYDRLWQEACVEHPTRDAWWAERDLRPKLAELDIPVYLGCDVDNAPLHLPSTFGAWRALADNPNARMVLMAPGGLTWPWESMHTEALAWYDHWLKGRDTQIMAGPPIRYALAGPDDWHTATSWPPPESTLVPYALAADGRLTTDAPEPGERSYLYLPPGSGRSDTANPPTLPDQLSWETAVLAEPLDVAGDIELQLDATITGVDTGWLAVLYAVDEKDKTEALTGGWLRASLRAVDEELSSPGAPELPCTIPVAVPPGEVVTYRIPIVPNARRIPVGHRLRLVLASSDADGSPTVLGFTHVPVAESSVNTVHASSRLLLPILGSTPS